jgi:hypothetical protein
VAFGFVNCMMGTSDVWVGGTVGIVVWLDIVCCMDNCCNCFVGCLAGCVCDEPKIPSTCGPTLYLVLSSIECGTYGNISYNKPD